MKHGIFLLALNLIFTQIAFAEGSQVPVSSLHFAKDGFEAWTGAHDLRSYKIVKTCEFKKYKDHWYGKEYVYTSYRDAWPVCSSGTREFTNYNGGHPWGAESWTEIHEPINIRSEVSKTENPISQVRSEEADCIKTQMVHIFSALSSSANKYAKTNEPFKKAAITYISNLNGALDYSHPYLAARVTTYPDSHNPGGVPILHFLVSESWSNGQFVCNTLDSEAIFRVLKQ